MNYCRERRSKHDQGVLNQAQVIGKEKTIRNQSCYESAIIEAQPIRSLKQIYSALLVL